MSRSFYDIDPAGEVLCTYTNGEEKEKLKSVSACSACNAISSAPAAYLSNHHFFLATIFYAAS